MTGFVDSHLAAAAKTHGKGWFNPTVIASTIYGASMVKQAGFDNKAQNNQYTYKNSKFGSKNGQSSTMSISGNVSGFIIN